MSVSFRNRLLAGLPESDSALLTPHLELIPVEVRHSMEEIGKPIKQIYFMEEGIASVVATGADGAEIDIAGGFYGAPEAELKRLLS